MGHNPRCAQCLVNADSPPHTVRKLFQRKLKANESLPRVQAALDVIEDEHHPGIHSSSSCRARITASLRPLAGSLR
jgi:hypothetical protein